MYQNSPGLAEWGLRISIYFPNTPPRSTLLLCRREGLHTTSTIVTTSLTARTPKTFAHFTPPTRTPEASGAALAFAAASPTHTRSPSASAGAMVSLGAALAGTTHGALVAPPPGDADDTSGRVRAPSSPARLPRRASTDGASPWGSADGLSARAPLPPSGGARRLPMCRDLLLHSPRPVAAGTRRRLPRPRPPRRRRRRRR